MKKFVDFLKQSKVALIVLFALLAAALTSVGCADAFQKDWGKVEVTSGQLDATTVDDEQYSMGYKLYIPKPIATNAIISLI